MMNSITKQDQDEIALAERAAEDVLARADALRGLMALRSSKPMLSDAVADTV